MAVTINIALVVQEGMKDNLQKLVNDHKPFLSDNYIVSTKGTAAYLHEKTEITVNKVVSSGQEGGDINIANMVLEDDIDVAIFLLNPIRYFPLVCEQMCRIGKAPRFSACGAWLILKQGSTGIS
jgi:methylglyoxal synthase